jgi:hypothetical protein
MRKPKPMVRATRARYGYFLGVLILTEGAWLTFGLGPAVIVLGLGVLAYWVLLYDVDDMPERVEREDGPW